MKAGPNGRAAGRTVPSGSRLSSHTTGLLLTAFLLHRSLLLAANFIHILDATRFLLNSSPFRRFTLLLTSYLLLGIFYRVFEHKLFNIFPGVLVDYLIAIINLQQWPVAYVWGVPFETSVTRVPHIPLRSKASGRVPYHQSARTGDDATHAESLAHLSR
uniref:Uncharacterized protein n=1 Tax=Anopheles coluzzii TaxID=1518534 RepID=A0A8W7PM40_ANOCL